MNDGCLVIGHGRSRPLLSSSVLRADSRGGTSDGETIDGQPGGETLSTASEVREP